MSIVGRYGHWFGLAVLIAYLVITPVPGGSDAHNYYALDLTDPYRNRWAASESFVYSPAFGQLIYPATLLPIDVFYKMFQAISLACLGWLLGPLGAALALIVPFTRSELNSAQIHLELAVMCVVGMRYSGAWAFGLLTKVTPGVGLLYFAARREWGKGGVSAVDHSSNHRRFGSCPSRCVGRLDRAPSAESSTRTVQVFALNEWPAAFRASRSQPGWPVMAGWRGRPAAIPVIVCFALPAIWPGALTLLAAVPRLSKSR